MSKNHDVNTSYKCSFSNHALHRCALSKPRMLYSIVDVFLKMEFSPVGHFDHFEEMNEDIDKLSTIIDFPHSSSNDGTGNMMMCGVACNTILIFTVPDVGRKKRKTGKKKNDGRQRQPSLSAKLIFLTRIV